MKLLKHITLLSLFFVIGCMPNSQPGCQRRDDDRCRKADAVVANAKTPVESCKCGPDAGCKCDLSTLRKQISDLQHQVSVLEKRATAVENHRLPTDLVSQDELDASVLLAISEYDKRLSDALQEWSKGLVAKINSDVTSVNDTVQRVINEGGQSLSHLQSEVESVKAKYQKEWEYLDKVSKRVKALEDASVCDPKLVEKEFDKLKDRVNKIEQLVEDYKKQCERERKKAEAVKKPQALLNRPDNWNGIEVYLSDVDGSLSGKTWCLPCIKFCNDARSRGVSHGKTYDKTFVLKNGSEAYGGRGARAVPLFLIYREGEVIRSIEGYPGIDLLLGLLR